MPSIAPSRLVETFWHTQLEAHVEELHFSRDRSVLLAILIDGNVAVIDVDGGEVRSRVHAHRNGAVSGSWHPESQEFATIGQDGFVRIWNARMPEPLFEFAAGHTWGTRVRYSPSGQYLASAAGRKISIWHRSGAAVRSFPDQESTVMDIGWSPRRTLDIGKPEALASTCYGNLRIWHAHNPNAVRTLKWKGSSLVLAWSPDGRYIATGDQDSSVHFWILRKGRDLEMTGYPIKVRELAWDARSRLLATGGGPQITVWNCSGKGPAGTHPLELMEHEARVTVLAFQHSGPILASAAEDERVILWQPENGVESQAVIHTCGAPSALSWSHDDQLLAIATETGEVCLVAAGDER